jgi:ferredoxin
VCPIGAIQNVAAAVGDPCFAVPAAVLVMVVLPLVFTLFFGRTFCGAVCPLGAVQELVTLWPVRVPVWLDHALGLLAYVYLGAAVLLAYTTGKVFIVCRYDPFVDLFRLSAGVGMLALAAGFLVVGAFIGRPYCRYLCPYGALLGLVARLARRQVRIPPGRCIQCRLCEDVCPYGAIRPPTVTLRPAEHRRGRRRLTAMLLLLPLLVALGFVLGRRLEVPLAKLHPTVALAEQVRREETGQAAGTTDASDNFRNTGRSVADLYAEAGQLTGRLGRAGGWLGAWVGLVLGGKLIQLSMRRRRTDYEPDPARCVACGRCFWYCPAELET